MVQRAAILFYSTKKPFGYFSNFARYPIKMDGVLWPTSEHYFQAMKSPSAQVQEEIRRLDRPMEAATRGRSTPLRDDWNTVDPHSAESRFISMHFGAMDFDGHVIRLVKDRVMYEAVYAKFTQWSELKQNLLDTDNALLVEDTTTDDYWGWGTARNGLNKLGQILMAVRYQLKEDAA